MQQSDRTLAGSFHERPPDGSLGSRSSVRMKTSTEGSGRCSRHDRNDRTPAAGAGATAFLAPPASAAASPAPVDSPAVQDLIKRVC